MEEMIMLPRATSPKKREPLPEDEIEAVCSPMQRYMISMGAFPGSSHIAGENAELLMSGFFL
jgi:hypothetical protein